MAGGPSTRVHLRLGGSCQYARLWGISLLGPPKPRRLDEPVTSSLEALVPADSFDRHLEAKLDLGFVRQGARNLYADRGRPGIDPVVFFRLQLVMVTEGVRALAATTSLRSLAADFGVSHETIRSILRASLFAPASS